MPIQARPARLGPLLLFAALLAGPSGAQEHISHGRFEDVTLYRPAGEVKGFALFLSGDAGWDGEVAALARALAAEGALVAGIDTPQLFESLIEDGGDCVLPDGDLENLSHYLQGYAKLPTYYTPVLVGYSSGATLAYAMIAQAPANTFAGAISLGFCADLEVRKPLCRGENVHFRKRRNGKALDLLPAATLGVPWVAIQGEKDRVCSARPARAFAEKVAGASYIQLPGATHDLTPASWVPPVVSSFRNLSAKRIASLPPPPSRLGDLPVVEVPASGAGESETFAVLVSGDGGWAGLDRQVAAALATRGIPVAGLDSLRYFWTARTPQGFADDLDRLLRFYATHWNKRRALLVGYSQGADVLPFAVNRLPATSRALVKQTVLMGLGENASFEFHLGNWLGSDDGVPILPEAQKLDAATTLCLYGDDESDSLCPRIPTGHVRAQVLPGGHHFDGAYDKLADVILSTLPR